MSNMATIEMSSYVSAYEISNTLCLTVNISYEFTEGFRVLNDQFYRLIFRYFYNRFKILRYDSYHKNTVLSSESITSVWCTPQI